MSNSRRNIDVLKKMVMYCDQIDEAVEHFGNSFERLQESSPYKNATAMCILQIGELTTHLSEDFKKSYSEMPWRAIKNMRNIAAHSYGDFDVDTLWGTITDNIPTLREYCKKIVHQYEIASQNCNEEIDYGPDEEPDEEQGQSFRLM